MSDEKTKHAYPPILHPEIYQTIVCCAEAHPEAVLVIMRDPEACATVTGLAQDGVVHAWNVTMPTTDESDKALFIDEMKRRGLTEREIIYLAMPEQTKATKH